MPSCMPSQPRPVSPMTRISGESPSCSRCRSTRRGNASLTSQSWQRRARGSMRGREAGAPSSARLPCSCGDSDAYGCIVRLHAFDVRGAHVVPVRRARCDLATSSRPSARPSASAQLATAVAAWMSRLRTSAAPTRHDRRQHGESQRIAPRLHCGLSGHALRHGTVYAARRSRRCDAAEKGGRRVAKSSRLAFLPSARNSRGFLPKRTPRRRFPPARKPRQAAREGIYRGRVYRSVHRSLDSLTRWEQALHC